MSERPLGYEARPGRPSHRGSWVVASVVIAAMTLLALWFVGGRYLFLLHDD